MLTGVNLKQFAHTFRSGAVGMSTSKFGDKWFMLPKGRAIFKNFKTNFRLYNLMTNLRMVNELLCYEIAKQLNIECAECEVATINNTRGVVSYDVAKPGEKLVQFFEISYDDVNFTALSKIIDRYILDGYKVDKNQCMKDLFTRVVFDTLTIQTDSHGNNIHFLIDEDNKTFRVAPPFDNEFGFNIANIARIMEEKGVVSEDLLQEYLSKIYSFIHLRPKSKDQEANSFESNLKEVIKIAKAKPEYSEIFNHMVSNFNMKDAIQKVEEKGVEIGIDYENYLLISERMIKSLIKEHSNIQVSKQEVEQEYPFL